MHGLSSTGRRPEVNSRPGGAPLAKPPDQARGVVATAPSRLHLGVERVDLAGHGELGPVPLGFRQRDGQVLAHPVHAKPKSKRPSIIVSAR